MTDVRSAAMRSSHTIPSRSDQQQRHNRRRLPGENGERPSSDLNQERRCRKKCFRVIPAEIWTVGVPTVAAWRLTGVAFFSSVAFFEIEEPWRSPHRLKFLSDSSNQKSAAKTSPGWKGVLTVLGYDPTRKKPSAVGWLFFLGNASNG